MFFYFGLTLHLNYELVEGQHTSSGSTGAFEIKVGRTNPLKLYLISNILGCSKSLVTHPASTTHKNFSNQERLLTSIKKRLLCISYGVEYQEDLIDIILQPLSHVLL